MARSTRVPAEHSSGRDVRGDSSTGTLVRGSEARRVRTLQLQRLHVALDNAIVLIEVLQPRAGEAAGRERHVGLRKGHDNCAHGQEESLVCKQHSLQAHAALVLKTCTAA